jgi:hypothetical protein
MLGLTHTLRSDQTSGDFERIDSCTVVAAVLASLMTILMKFVDTQLANISSYPITTRQNFVMSCPTAFLHAHNSPDPKCGSCYGVRVVELRKWLIW